MPHSATAAAHPPTHHSSHQRLPTGTSQKSRAGFQEAQSVHISPLPSRRGRPSGKLEPRLGLQHKTVILPAEAHGGGGFCRKSMWCTCRIQTAPTCPRLSGLKTRQGEQRGESGCVVTQCSLQQTSATRRGPPPEKTAPLGSKRN